MERGVDLAVDGRCRIQEMTSPPSTSNQFVLPVTRFYSLSTYSCIVLQSCTTRSHMHLSQLLQAVSTAITHVILMHLSQLLQAISRAITHVTLIPYSFAIIRIQDGVDLILHARDRLALVLES